MAYPLMSKLPVLLAAFLATAVAQQPRVVLPMVAGGAVPLYPPLARATKVQGVVHLRIVTDVAITAERKSLPVPQLVEAIQAAYGEIELSLSPVTVAELVHGIYRARTPEVSQRRREYIDELVKLMPLHFHGGGCRHRTQQLHDSRNYPT